MSLGFRSHSARKAKNRATDSIPKSDAYVQSPKEGKLSMLKKLTLAAAAAGALTLGSLTFATPSYAAAGIYGGAPAVESNVIQARCWRNWRGRVVCNGRHHRHKHCWWRRGVRHCTWR
jgi:hypothetical protein